MDELIPKTKNNGWFKIGNIFFEKHTKNIGYTPAVVYLCIKRYMHNTERTAFPSERLIAEQLNMNKRTVIRAIKILENHKLLIKQKTKYKGRWLHNTYYFTQSSEWLAEPYDKNASDCVTNKLYPDDKKYKEGVQKSHLNNTKKKKTNIKNTYINKRAEARYLRKLSTDNIPDFSNYDP